MYESLIKKTKQLGKIGEKPRTKSAGNRKNISLSQLDKKQRKLSNGHR